MSTSVDERVVSMKFDNKQFEDGAKESLGTLDKLKSSMNMEESAKSFSKIDAAANNVNLSGLEKSVDSISARFTNLGIVGVTALQNITNKVVDAGTNLVKSLTVDNISAGWEKYNDLTTSTQTIMAATQASAEAAGQTQEQQMADVNKQLDDLNWYTDETSYNFVDMVGNIGKFTSAGLGLSESVQAMEGIANWAAVSGQNADTASRAMYQLSQAVGSGVVNLQDWRSIINANMSTTEFKNQVLDTAAAYGTLKKEEDGTYTSIVADADSITGITSNNMQESLTKGKWFTKDVLMGVLGDYGKFSSGLKSIYDETGYETSDIIDAVNKYASAGENKAAVLKDFVNGIDSSMGEIDIPTLTAEFDKLSSSEYDLSRKSFAAAQEAKTFGDAINATKDAVSTGWMKSFNLIFGDYLEAKELWTGLANTLYDIFASGAEARNEMLQQWHDLGGRNSAINIVKNLFESVKSVVDTLNASFREMFPAMTGERLTAITKDIEYFTSKLKFSQSELNDMKDLFTGFFSILRTGFDGIKFVAGVAWEVLQPVFLVLRDIFDVFLDLAGKVGSKITEFNNYIKSLGILENILKTVHNLMNKLISVYSKTKAVIHDSIAELKRTDVYQSLAEHLGELKDVIKEFGSGLLKKFADLMGTASENTAKVGDSANKSSTGFGVIKGAIKGVMVVLDWLTTKILEVKDTFGGFWKTLSDAYKKANATTNGNDGVFGIIKSIANTIKEGIKGIPDFFSNLFGGNKIKKTAGEAKSGAKTIAEAIGEGLGKVSLDDVAVAAGTGSLVYMLVNLGKTFKNLANIVSSGKGSIIDQLKTKIFAPLDSLSGMLTKFGKAAEAEAILKMAESIGILAAAVVALAQLDNQQLANATAAILALMFGLSMLFKAISKLEDSSLNRKKINAETEGIKNVSGSLSSFFNGISTIFSNIGKTIKTSTTIASIAVLITSIGLTMLLIAKAIKNINEIPPLSNQTWAILGGFVGVVGLLSIVAISLSSFQKETDMLGTSGKSLVTLAGLGTYMLAFGALMEIFANVVSKFSTIDDATVARATKAIRSLAIIVSALAGVAFLLKWLKYKLINTDLATPKTLTVLDTVKSVFSKLISVFQMIAFAASFWIIAHSIDSLMESVAKFKDVDWGTVEKAGVVMGVFGGAIWLAGRSMGGVQFLAAVIGIGLIADQITKFTGSVKADQFKSITSTVADALMGFALALTTFAIVAAIVGSFPNVANGLGLLQKALLPLAAVLLASAIAFKLVSSSLDDFGEAVENHGPAIFKALVTVIGMVAAAILAQKSQIAGAVLAVLISVSDVLTENGGAVLDQICTMITDFVGKIISIATKLIPTLVNAVVNIINALSDAIRNNADTIIAAIENLIDAVAELFGKAVSKFTGGIIPSDFAKKIGEVGIKFGLVFAAIKKIGSVVGVFDKLKTGIFGASDGAKGLIGSIKGLVKGAIGLKGKIGVGLSAITKFGAGLGTAGYMAVGTSTTLTGTLCGAFEVLASTVLTNPLLTGAVAAGMLAVGKVVWDTSYGMVAADTDLSESQKKLKASVDENLKSQKTMLDQDAEEIGTAATKESHYENLIDMLGTMVDKNGNIKEGYEGQADTIENGICNGLGITKENLDEILTKNQNWSDKLKEIAKEQEAASFQSSIKDDYDTATSKMNGAIEDLANAKNDLDAYNSTKISWKTALKDSDDGGIGLSDIIKNGASTIGKAYQEGIEEFGESAQHTKQEYIDNIGAMVAEGLDQEKKGELSEQQQQYLSNLENYYSHISKTKSDLQSTYDDALTTYQNYANVEQLYNNLSSDDAATRNKAIEDTKNYMAEMSKSYKTASDSTASALADQAKEADQMKLIVNSVHDAGLISDTDYQGYVNNASNCYKELAKSVSEGNSSIAGSTEDVKNTLESLNKDGVAGLLNSIQGTDLYGTFSSKLQELGLAYDDNTGLFKQIGADTANAVGEGYSDAGSDSNQGTGDSNGKSSLVHAYKMEMDQLINESDARGPEFKQKGADIANNVANGINGGLVPVQLASAGMGNAAKAVIDGDDYTAEGNHVTSSVADGIARGLVPIQLASAGMGTTAKSTIDNDDYSEQGGHITNSVAKGINGGLVEVGLAISGMTKTTKQSMDDNSDATSIGTKVVNTFDAGIAQARSPEGTGKAQAQHAKDGMGEVSAYTTGQYFVDGFIDGSKSKRSSLRNAASSLARSALDSMRKTLDEHSPSKKTFKYGKYFVQGFINGVNHLSDKASTVSSSFAQSSLDSMNSVVDLVNSAMSDTYDDLDPVIRPVVDLSNIQNGSNQIDDLLSNNQAYSLAFDSGSAVTSQSSRLANSVSGTVQNAMEDALSNFQSVNAEMNSNQVYSFNIPLDINGRQVAKATASYTQEELNKLTTISNRRGGMK
jgi:hypothetical protein